MHTKTKSSTSGTGSDGRLVVPACSPETISRLTRAGTPAEGIVGEIRARWVLKGPVEAKVVDSSAIVGANLLASFDLSKETSIQPTTQAQFAKKKAADEVMSELQMLQTGHMPGRKVVLVSEVSGGLVGCAIISMKGDGRLKRVPYIESIARNDPYEHAVLRDCATSVGAITLRATVEAVVLEAGGTVPEMFARVRLFNRPSHYIFKELEFESRSRLVTETQQVIVVRTAGLALPEPVGEKLYMPLRRA